MCENTPTKSYTRVDISPNSKAKTCVLCCTDIANADLRRKLFGTTSQKTKACLNLEIVLGIELDEHALLTDIICRKCSDRNETLVKKIIQVRERFAYSKSKIVSEKGIHYQKRLGKQDSNEQVSEVADIAKKDDAEPAARKSLFSRRDSELEKPHHFKTLKTRACSTETDSASVAQTKLESLSSVEVVITYPNSVKRIKLPEKTCAIGRQLAVGNPKSFVSSVMDHSDFQTAFYDEACSVVRDEIQGLCSHSNPSLLRQTTYKDLGSFTWDNMNNELCERTPRFHKFLVASVNNPSHKRNVHKKGDALIPPMCDAACQLISVFSEEMNATRRIKSVVLKKAGLKKTGFKQLSALNICMGYQATSKMFEKFGDDFDKRLMVWKNEVEDGVRKEKQLISMRQGDSIDAAGEAELSKHRKTMHPGYSFTGDNVDIICKPRQMTAKNQNKDHHMFQFVAYKNRISPNHLSDEKQLMEVDKVPLTMFLPNADEQKQLIHEFVILVGKTWVKHIPALQWFKNHLPERITHEYMKETKQKTEKVNLGVLQKNEQYEAEMIDLLEWIHKYVPGHAEDDCQSLQPVKVLSGGDYLTFERHKEAQAAMQDARTPATRLEGLIPKIEDFHTQAEWNKVIWNHLYSTSSSRDIGTLYAARNAIDARNVYCDPDKNFYASSEFLDKVLDAYLIAGALHHFNMDSVDDEPSRNKWEGLTSDCDEKDYVTSTIIGFIEEHVVHQVPEIIMPTETVELKCQVCGKSYIRKHALKAHETKVHGIQPTPEAPKAKQDHLYNYTHQLLILLLLRANHNDAIKLGDGARVIRLYKYFMLFFKVSKCPKYAIAMLHLQAQVKCLLTPRLSHSLVWNRFVNHQGKADTNHPMDLEVEHDNKYFKNDCHSYRGEFTEKTVNRISRSTDTSEEIVKNFDRVTSVPRPSGNHSRLSTEGDVNILLDHVCSADVFKNIPGRCHLAYPDVPHNLLEKLDMDKIHKWMKSSLKRFGKKHFYNLT